MGNSCGSGTTFKTTCPYCGVGCGVDATTTDSKIVIEGDQTHPANFGLLCSKGYALADTLNDEGRLLKPMVNGVEASWSSAVSRIAQEFESVREAYGSEAIAFYVSGQILTEDYYVANKFVKGYLGTANIDTNSRLCMASSVAAHKRAFGSDTVPGSYEDLEHADVVVLVGSNLAWCHPVLFRRIQTAREAKPVLQTVVIDPRRTATAEQCDNHLQIKGGGESDAVLYLGLLRYLAERDCLDLEWIEQHTNGIDQALESASSWTIEKVAETVGLSVTEVLAFYKLYQNHPKIVTVYSQGVNQSHKGTDTVNAIINVHLATGRIGKKGCGPFSVTGQPNAMGGREVGGLANMLACHMDLENAQHQSLVQRYWNSPTIAKKQGLKAIDLFKAVKSRKIKALWVMATNPVDSMPNANDVAEAIAACPFVVVSDVTAQTDTAALADVLLPARAWSEKDGTVTNSERRVSRQAGFRTAPEAARPDWWAIAKVAQFMGYQAAFDYDNPSEIFAEYAGLSGFENNGTRDFDISAYQSITSAEYDKLKPFKWPQTATGVGNHDRFFADGGFYTPDRKAKLIAIDVKQPNNEVSTARSQQTGKFVSPGSVDASDTSKNSKLAESSDRFLLNTGRIRDQWHTMTRTGLSARLSSHLGEPFVEINPEDAKKLAIEDASIVDVKSLFGTSRLRALITDRVAISEVFVPMHWTNVYSSLGRINAMVHPIHDPVSGQPASKNQQVVLAPTDIKTYGYMVSRQKPSPLNHEYWAIAPAESGWKTEFASSLQAEELMQSIVNRAKISISQAQGVSFSDQGQSCFRECWFDENNRLQQAVFLSPSPVKVSRNAVVELLSHDFTSSPDRLAVVSAAGLATSEDIGAIICSCMQVGSKTIQKAIDAGCDTVQRVGEQCRAGTQCGTCRSDIVRMIKLDSLKKDEPQRDMQTAV